MSDNLPPTVLSSSPMESEKALSDHSTTETEPEKQSHNSVEATVIPGTLSSTLSPPNVPHSGNGQQDAQQPPTITLQIPLEPPVEGEGKGEEKEESVKSENEDDNENEKRTNEDDNNGQGQALWEFDPERKKRTRTSFTHNQLNELERAFQMSHIPDFRQRKVLSERLGLTEKTARYWFQNRRQKLREVQKREEDHSHKIITGVKSAMTGDYRMDPFTSGPPPPHFYAMPPPGTAPHSYQPTRPAFYMSHDPYYHPIGPHHNPPHPMLNPSDPASKGEIEEGIPTNGNGPYGPYRDESAGSLPSTLPAWQGMTPVPVPPMESSIHHPLTSVGPIDGSHHTCCPCTRSIAGYVEQLGRIVPGVSPNNTTMDILNAAVSYVQNMQSFVNTGAFPVVMGTTHDKTGGESENRSGLDGLVSNQDKREEERERKEEENVNDTESIGALPGEMASLIPSHKS